MTPNASEPSTKKETGNYNENLEGYPQETPENTLFDKWAQEITQFIEEIEQKRYPYYTETPPIHDRNEAPKSEVIVCQGNSAESTRGLTVQNTVNHEPNHITIRINNPHNMMPLTVSHRCR